VANGKRAITLILRNKTGPALETDSTSCEPGSAACGVPSNLGSKFQTQMRQLINKNHRDHHAFALEMMSYIGHRA
jgi:hypothetical protein